jgi:hypothetical protein
MEHHFTLTENPEAPVLVVDGIKVRLELDSKEPTQTKEEA